MTLHHVTNRRNLRSILRTGLDPSRAIGRRKAVWGVTESRVGWAIVHTLSKPRDRNARLSDIVVIRFTIARARARRFGKGVWYVPATIPIDPADVIGAPTYGS